MIGTSKVSGVWGRALLFCTLMSFQVKCWLSEGFQKLLFPYEALGEYWEALGTGIVPAEKRSSAVPIVLWGDEGTTNQHTWMLATWKCG